MRRIVAILVLCTGVSLGLAPAAAEDGFLLLRIGGGYLKWGGAAHGTGANVTYALATAPIEQKSARNCSHIGSPTSMLAKNGIDMATFEDEVEAAFAMWATVADLTFEPVDDADQAQIVIGAQAVPRGRAYANVDYEIGRVSGTHRLKRALVCLNPTMPWKIGFGGRVQAYDLRYVLAHEIGHAIGLDHPGARGHLMGFQYAETRRGLSAGDIAGATTLYGPASPLVKATASDSGPADVVQRH